MQEGRLLALDQSITLTGYAIFDDNKLTGYGLMPVNNKLHKDKKLAYVIQHLADFIDGVDPSFIVYEGTTLQKSPDTSQKLAKLAGSVITLCLYKHIPYAEVLPSAWRKMLGIGVLNEDGTRRKRKDYKLISQFLINESYGISVSEDEADAICIGLAYLNRDKEIINKI